MSIDTFGDEGNITPEGYVSDETYDECNDDRLTFLRLLIDAKPFAYLSLAQEIEKEIAHRATNYERREAGEKQPSVSEAPADDV